MNKSTYYSWDETTKKYQGKHDAQIDPLESAKAGHTVYCGMPQNATEVVPPEEKDGFNIIWNGTGWEYKQQPQEKAPEPTELELAWEAYYKALNALTATDYRALKYVDGEYTEEEYAVYKTERAKLRQVVREAEEKVKKL